MAGRQRKLRIAAILIESLIVTRPRRWPSKSTKVKQLLLWLSLVPIRVSVPACERPKDSTTKQPAALRNFSRLRRRIYVGGSRAAFAATLESRPVYPG